MARFLNRYISIDILALLFCLAILVFSLVIGYFRQVGAFGVETDFYGVYAIETANILAGQPYTYQHNPPGYCLLLAAITYLTGDSFSAGKLISAFATAIFGEINYLLLKSLFNAKIALIVTIVTLLAIIPSPLVASTDVVGAAFIILPIWLFICPTLSLEFNYFLSGITAGIAYLIRTNAIFVIVGIIVSLILLNPHQQTFRKRWWGVTLVIGGLILIVSPWLIYNWQINGSPFASTTYAQIAAHFYHPQGDELITSVNEMNHRFNSLSEVIFYKSGQLFIQYFEDILLVNIPKIIVSDFVFRYVDFPIYQLLILPPLILFFVSFLFFIDDLFCKNKLIKEQNISQKRQSFLLINFLGYLVLGLVGFNRRYYLFFLPCVFLIVIYPIYYQRFGKQILKVRLLKLAISSILIILINISLTIAASVQTYSLIVSEPRYLLEIAAFLKNRATPNQVIIVRKPHLAYLAGLKQVFPLAKNAEEYLAEARKIQASYIVYSDYEATLYPGLKFLENPQSVPQNFQLIYRHQPSNTLVYEIKKY